MGQRTIHPKLQELYDKNIPVYSISRLDTINNCLLSAYKAYILKEKGTGNIYSYAGTKIHDVLEALMNDKATVDDLLPAMNEELDDLAMAGIDFPKDPNGDSTLRNNWIKDMVHFCCTYTKPRGKYSTEEFFLYKSERGHYLQGYIDLIRHHDDNGLISIYDYKTSSLYTGEGIKEHGRQLLLYAMAKMQQGCTVRSVNWIFLKYAEIRFRGKKTAKSKEKTDLVKVVERRKIGAEMEKYIRADLEEAGYDDLDINAIAKKFRETNDIEFIPEDIRSNYKILPYVCEYEITDEAIQETEDYINDTIEKWESLSGNPEDYPHRSFTKIQKNGKEVADYFFCTALCDYKKCPDVTAFLDQYTSPDTNAEEDMFA